MLTLTPNATSVIRSLLDGSGLPRDGGIRIASTADGMQSFTVSTAPSPQAGDKVVENSGARVFLENQAADMLVDTVLDADVDEAGNVQFLLSASREE